MVKSPEFLELLDYITQEIHTLDIAGYLKEEIYALSKYLHIYKLKNIWENIDTLKEYLYFLDDHSTKQLAQLDYTALENGGSLEDRDISYYLSKTGAEQIGDSLFRAKLATQDPQLNYAMQSVK